MIGEELNPEGTIYKQSIQRRKKRMEYYYNNLDVNKKRSKLYYYKNRDKLIEQHKKYNKEHAKELSEYNKKYRKNNREKIKIYNRDYKRKIRNSKATGEPRMYVRKVLVTAGLKPHDVLARFGLTLDDVKKIANS